MHFLVSIIATLMALAVGIHALDLSGFVTIPEPPGNKYDAEEKPHGLTHDPSSEKSAAMSSASPSVVARSAEDEIHDDGSHPLPDHLAASHFEPTHIPAEDLVPTQARYMHDAIHAKYASYLAARSTESTNDEDFVGGGDTLTDIEDTDDHDDSEEEFHRLAARGAEIDHAMFGYTENEVRLEDLEYVPEEALERLSARDLDVEDVEYGTSFDDGDIPDDIVENYEEGDEYAHYLAARGFDDTEYQDNPIRPDDLNYDPDEASDDEDAVHHLAARGVNVDSTEFTGDQTRFEDLGLNAEEASEDDDQTDESPIRARNFDPHFNFGKHIPNVSTRPTTHPSHADPTVRPTATTSCRARAKHAVSARAAPSLSQPHKAAKTGSPWAHAFGGLFDYTKGRNHPRSVTVSDKGQRKRDGDSGSKDDSRHRDQAPVKGASTSKSGGIFDLPW